MALNQFFRYFLVGGSAALLDWGMFALLAIYGSLHYLIAATISFLLATLLNYVLSIKFVFQSGVRFSKQRELSLVFLVSGLGLAIHHLGLSLMLEIFALPLMVAKITATGIVFFWNFLLRQKIIFRHA